MNGQDASYRYLANLLAIRARTLPRDVVGRRAERAFRNLCLQVRPHLSLEIGAHEADFSRWLKSELPSARCVAFEANPYVHEKYAADLVETGVEYLHLAVSEATGTVELGVPRQLVNTERGTRFAKPRASRMASLAQHRYAEESEVVEVPSTRLDDLVELAEDDVVVAWIDVEGASGAVLSSGAEVLSRAALIYIEVENEPVWEGQWLDVDVARFLGDCGLVPVLRDVQRPHQFNVVFARTDIAADPRTARLCNKVYRPSRRTRRPRTA